MKRRLGMIHPSSYSSSLDGIVARPLRMVAIPAVAWYLTRETINGNYARASASSRVARRLQTTQQPSSQRRATHWFNENNQKEGLSNDRKGDDSDNDDQRKPRDNEDVNMTSAGMIATIGIYKNYISPLLPPACRFLPTCSQYGVQAIEQFGPTKGVILTAWRLMRCSPFGGRGYDPPRWPPVLYTYGSY
eukprot:CAMPEP_0184861716 /NCGR_PEP_ID=MMETSP0580-20130426/6335_1 /TAXON_ID=1118495 /ORGANISM="Dactyliosolen fragilissimus" /LENGTH=189 /DNA_ID=CAMNT_0027359307 /DNA_START=152 /DNA_END=721 /DNA_ORIENTATION=+